MRRDALVRLGSEWRFFVLTSLCLPDPVPIRRQPDLLESLLDFLVDLALDPHLHSATVELLLKLILNDFHEVESLLLHPIEALACVILRQELVAKSHLSVQSGGVQCFETAGGLRDVVCGASFDRR